MPNLNPPVVTTEIALAYSERILAALPANIQMHFEPLMTLYLTDNTKISEIVKAKASGMIHGVKFYPALRYYLFRYRSYRYSQVFCHTRNYGAGKHAVASACEVNDTKVDVFDKEKILLIEYYFQ